MKTLEFYASGTTCNSCEILIETQALHIDGVKEIKFNHKTEKGTVKFDEKKTNIQKIFDKIQEKGFCCSLEKPKESNIVWYSLAIIGLIVLGYFTIGFVNSIPMPQLSQGISYGLLFVVGLLTGFHCIAMCGGFVAGYTSKAVAEGRSTHSSHIMYAAGKTLSYTIIGAIFGLLGSIIAFTPTMRGIAGILGGIFLILFGLRMLNVIPALRYFRIPMPSVLSNIFGRGTKSPLIIGLLNGLMIACGPLQAIYIMAAGSGSMIEGAVMLFVFGIGTLPAMLGFGYLASYISKGMTGKILKLSGAIVIILGLLMINNGLTLTGTGVDIPGMYRATIAGSAAENVKLYNSKENSEGQTVETNAAGYQEIRMTVDGRGFTPNQFVLQKGVPVKWIIDGKQLNGCNNAIMVPALGLDFKLKPGEQTIEFTPTDVGTIKWSCWMGMLKGAFIVKDEVEDGDSESAQAEIQTEIQTTAKSDELTSGLTSGGSCGMGGGGCGCGRNI
jgi:sulfite exporter TauE/SafE/copper chaperone CopZ